MFETENATEIVTPLPRLLPGETLHKVEEVPLYVPNQPPSSLRELERLAQVKAGGEVGAFGPARASVALERLGEEEVSAELRKYEVLFGRDSLRVAIDVMPMYPLLAHATIHALAKLQGTTYHEGREEERNTGRRATGSSCPAPGIGRRSGSATRGWRSPAGAAAR